MRMLVYKDVIICNKCNTNHFEDLEYTKKFAKVWGEAVKSKE